MRWRDKLREISRLLDEVLQETAPRELAGKGSLEGARSKGGVLVKKLPELVARVKAVLAGAVGRGAVTAPAPAPEPVSCLVERDGDILRDRADNVIVVSSRRAMVSQFLQERDGDLIRDRGGKQLMMRAA